MEEIENLWEIQSFRESFLWKVPKFWLVDDSTWPLGSLFSSEGRLSTPLFSQLIVSVPLPQHILIKVWILVGFDVFIAFVMSLRWTLRPDNLKTYIRLPRSVQHFDGSVTFERIKPCTPNLKAKMKWLSVCSYGKMGQEDISFLWKKKKFITGIAIESSCLYTQASGVLFRLTGYPEEYSWLVLYMYSCIALQIACLQLAFNNGMVTWYVL